MKKIQIYNTNYYPFYIKAKSLCYNFNKKAHYQFQDIIMVKMLTIKKKPSKLKLK